MNPWMRVSMVLLITLVVVLAGAGFLYYKSQQTVAAQDQQLIEELGKLIELPQGETPSIATISDIEKLKEQPAFAKAKNGDKVIIYQQARKAIIYDPTAKKIIDVAPISVGSASAQPQSQESSPSAAPQP